MSSILPKTAVRTVFACTGRAIALRQCESVLGRYLALAQGVSAEDGRRMVEVPWIPGVDEDIRRCVRSSGRSTPTNGKWRGLS